MNCPPRLMCGLTPRSSTASLRKPVVMTGSKKRTAFDAFMKLIDEEHQKATAERRGLNTNMSTAPSRETMSTKKFPMDDFASTAAVTIESESLHNNEATPNNHKRIRMTIHKRRDIDEDHDHDQDDDLSQLRGWNTRRIYRNNSNSNSNSSSGSSTQSSSVPSFIVVSSPPSGLPLGPAPALPKLQPGEIIPARGH